ncbi:MULTISPECIES: hypothetical protein [unclassified Streptomyces]|uniref:hypothetical protein n=1 Tax=unclassified Streptomyces TaxID=2593676 RepID=UPI000F50B0E0|nr:MULTISPECIES: hypothetical protein [unclassified Streptomyces]MDH6455312.1 hypothetical protein [Streptomyces sp. SAI-119]MDH6494135.1 hypothetical protein [Streptomyces sp. SAI-149]
MNPGLPDTDTVKSAVTGRRPTITPVERHLGIPQATFHRHYKELIDTHFRLRVSRPGQPATPDEKTSERTEANLHRLRQEDTDLGRTLPLYEDDIRDLTL